MAKNKRIIIGTDEFKELEAKWYTKLARKGFEDIEDTSKASRPLKSWDSNRYKAYTRSSTHLQIEALISYFNNARMLLISYNFKKPLHRRIWDFHCTGATTREIAKELKVSQYLVWYRIKQIRRAM
jgi:hypothetical protein